MIRHRKVEAKNKKQAEFDKSVFLYIRKSSGCLTLQQLSQQLLGAFIKELVDWPIKEWMSSCVRT